MSFWAVISACFAPFKEDSPLIPSLAIELNNTLVSALFNSGSFVSLVDEKYKTDIILKGTNAVLSPSGANDKELQQSGCYSIRISLGKRQVFHNLIFIKDLQVPCILGMDFMAKQNVVINAVKRLIKFAAKKPHDTSSPLKGTKAIHLPPYSETAVTITVPFPFVQGLIEAGPELPNKVLIMDGTANSFLHPTSKQHSCNVIMANFSHLLIQIPANTPIATITSNPNLKVKPLSACLSVSSDRPTIVDTSHVDKLDLSHIPPKYKPNYLSLLRSYADVP